MNLKELTSRVRSMTRDFTNEIFRENDIHDFINEGMERIKQTIPELVKMPRLEYQTQIPKLIPESYQHLLAVYGASRCYFQDTQFHQSTVLMNEFETKLVDFRWGIDDGSITLVDEKGKVLKKPYREDYVVDNYFIKRPSTDEGVI